MDQVWANRAASAEAAIAKRHLKRIWNLPGTQLGVVSWPPTTHDGEFRTWHYWWQAHLLDCLVDAQVRDPQPDRITKITRQIRSHRLRNNGSWVNNYYDDMAWLALALERAGRLAGVEQPEGAQEAVRTVPQRVGARGRRRHPVAQTGPVLQCPANGPAGIFLARYDDRLRRAQQMSDWIDETLIDPETHLVFDGIKAGSLVRAQYTYCQGAVIGLDVELAARTQDPEHATRVHRLVAAVRDNMAPDGIIKGAGGGDGGLFNGILARYLAFVVTTLPGTSRGHRGPRHRPHARAQVRAGGVGPPADRRRPTAVRAVLGTLRRNANGRREVGRSSSRGRSTPPRSPSAIYRCSCRAGC